MMATEGLPRLLALTAATVLILAALIMEYS